MEIETAFLLSKNLEFGISVLRFIAIKFEHGFLRIQNAERINRQISDNRKHE